MKFLLVNLALCSMGILNAQSKHIYVSDAGNWNNGPWQILHFDENGQNGEVFINTNLAWPQDILFLENENSVLISNLSSNRITRHDAYSGEFKNNFATNVSGPTRFKIGPDGLLYVLQWSGDGLVRRYKQDGTFVDNFTSVAVTQAIGLEWDADTNLYVSSYNGKKIHKFNKNGVAQADFITANLVGPTNIEIVNGEWLILDYNVGIIKRFDLSGNYLGDFANSIQQCEGIAFLDNGEILVGAGLEGAVRKYDANGNTISDIVPANSLGLIRPNAVVLREQTLSLREEEPKGQIGWLEGSKFYLQKELLDSIHTVQCFDMKGREHILLREQSYLDLSRLVKGNYIFKIQKDRMWLVQRFSIGQ